MIDLHDKQDGYDDSKKIMDNLDTELEEFTQLKLKLSSLQRNKV